MKHSSRPRQVFAGEMYVETLCWLALRKIWKTLTLDIPLDRLGWENSLAFIPYNDRFRIYRKNIARIIGAKSSVAQFNPLQEAEVAHFLLRILKEPDNLVHHIKM